MIRAEMVDMGPEWRSKVKVPLVLRWLFCVLIGALLTVAPFFYYRYAYTFAKRLRVVDAGLVYRSGCMTAPGFREALTRYHIRTVLNVNDEAPDPDLAEGYFTANSIRESELCKEMKVNYVFLCLDLVDRRQAGSVRPQAIEQFLALMDNPDNYPVLIHCRAGLHRTGCLVALYRMEYDHWSMQQALGELKALGFGEYASTKANDYIAQYVVNYRPGIRNQPSGVRNQGSVNRHQKQSVGPRTRKMISNPLADPGIIPARYCPSFDDPDSDL